MRIITNCEITKSDAEVLHEYDTSAGSDHHYTGIELLATDVYCPCKGVVIQQCLVDYYQSCVVQYSEHVALRFTHLKSCSVNKSDILTDYQHIGVADQFVHFEYLTVEPNDPPYKVFLPEGLIMYKHDPMLVLNGNVQFDHSYIPVQFSAEEKEQNYKELDQYIEAEIGWFNRGYGLNNTFDFDLNEDLRG